MAVSQPPTKKKYKKGFVHSQKGCEKRGGRGGPPTKSNIKKRFVQSKKRDEEEAVEMVRPSNHVFTVTTPPNSVVFTV